MLRTIYCGTRVSMEFKGGNFINGKNALLRTSNPFVQDAIENDCRFGTLKDDNVSGVSVMRNSRGREKQVKEVKTVKNVNDAIDYFAKMGYKVENDDMLEELKDKLSVSFPNMK